ncbi:MAG: ABC transporter substrate-binding protein [Elusimicrobia bacterium]|nr:ABC transporter substrate-binding protein [Elusimicrobiota bacterium]MBD3411761.1 ABC transporter substrate-binding protein [Elusimicrobiota bacterium]
MKNIGLTMVMLVIGSMAWAYERIVSIAPSFTDIIITLGAESKLIGVSNQCIVPEDISIERIGDFGSINKEKIYSLQPDLVITSDGMQIRFAQELSRLGLTVQTLESNSIDQITENIRLLGKLTDTLDQAEEMIKNINKKLQLIDDNASKLNTMDKPKVFIEIWNNPLTSVGRLSYIHEMVERAGGLNIAGEIKEKYPRLNPEWIVMQKPEIIILGHESASSEDGHTLVKNRTGWEQIPAVVNAEIHTDLPLEYFLQPGLHTIKGIMAFQDIIITYCNNKKP